MEADSHLGLANRMLARFARRVCLAFAIEGRSGQRYRVTGRPVPPPFGDRAAARARFDVGGGERCVLVFGGSLGARPINQAAIEGLVDAPYRIPHVAGTRDYTALRDRPRGERYELLEYLDRRSFAQALAACDLTVARSGGSVFEIAAHGRPAILVPYPHATADHQTTNARWMAGGGAALVIPDDELDGPRLAREVHALLNDEHRLRAMSEASARLARPDAAALLTPDEDLDALRAEKVELSDRRDGLAELLADGLLSREKVTEQAGRLTRHIADVDARITAAVGDSPVAALVDADDVAAAWETLDVRSRKAAVDLLMTVTVQPAGKGQRFDPEQVHIEWK